MSVSYKDLEIPWVLEKAFGWHMKWCEKQKRCLKGKEFLISSYVQFVKAAVAYQDISWIMTGFVLTALSALVHQPPKCNIILFDLLFYFFFSFFLKKRATKSLTSFPPSLKVRWRPPPLCTSLLYSHAALPLSRFLVSTRIALRHIRTRNLSPKRTKTETQKNSKQNKQKVLQRAACTGSIHRFWEPSITFDTKFTMAMAGWSGSISANRWLTLSVVLPCFLATKPKNFAFPPSGLLHFLSWGSISQNVTVLMG